VAGTSARNAIKHKNINFSPNMDEWAILTRLQDYEAEMKKKREQDELKRK
jgi:hypothetical protein